MTAVQVSNIKVLNNPSGFLEPFLFEITFEATQELQEDLEWRVTYVGSADSEAYDQVLDSVLVGPVPLGTNKFSFEAPAPDPTKIPSGDLLGVTVVLVECLYRDKVFVRVGYYVSNENPDDPPAGEQDGASRMDADLDGMDVEDIKSESDGEVDDDMDEMDVKENIVQPAETSQQSVSAVQHSKKPAADIHPSKIRRFILDDKPRVTRFPIEWDPQPQNQQQHQQMMFDNNSAMMMNSSSSNQGMPLVNGF